MDIIEKLTEYIKDWRRIKGDPRIWIIILFLFAVSLLVVYSATGSLAYQERGGNTSYYMFKQLGTIIMGIGIVILTSNIPYRFYARFSMLFLYLAIFFLIAAMFAGVSLNDASRWVRVPLIGLRFQPSELAKIALIIYVARMLAQNQGNIEGLKKVFRPIMLHTVIVTALIFKDNLSTALLLFAIIAVMMIIGGIPFKYILGTGTVAIVLVALVLLLAPVIPFLQRAETWRARVERFISPTEENKEANFQSTQAKIAVATGRVLGLGPGNSEQRYFLPQSYSDFIYAIIAEEYGLWGPVFVLSAYLFLLGRIGVIVRQCTHAFPALMVLGLGFLLVAQAFVNMGVSVGIFPVTGQSMPLVSRGASSVVAVCIALGAILSVSAQNRAEATQQSV